MDSRSLRRLSDPGILYPISFRLRSDLDFSTIDLDVVNYHHRGAALRFKDKEAFLTRGEDLSKFKIDIFLGKNCIREKMGFRLCWDTIATNGCFGVEFKEPLKSAVSRPERLKSNGDYLPTISSKDPVDANRQLFFQVHDVSESGLFMTTSLVNKHLLPGMTLGGCSLQIPGQPTQGELELRIENLRDAEVPNMFGLGVSIQKIDKAVLSALQAYLTIFANVGETTDRLQKVKTGGFLSKRMKGGLSFRVLSSQEDYEQLLKLRYSGYGKHGKVKAGSSVAEQGEGLEHEGTLVSGFIGDQMVSSMELRFVSKFGELRQAKYFSTSDLSQYLRPDVVEINKLVVHPAAQGSDVVLGMLQKAHAILVAQGGFDVIISATDQLCPMYERIGFKKIGHRAPHPTLSGVFLHLMLLKKEAYLAGQGLNPHAWSVVYEATQRHFEQLGISERLEFEFWPRIVKAITPWLLRWAKGGKAKKSGVSTAESGPGFAGMEPVEPMDVRWTAQHMLVGVLYPYVLEAERMIGSDRVAEILQEMGVDRAYFRQQGNWLSVDFLNEFTDRFERLGGDVAELSRCSGVRSLQRDVLGLRHFALKHFLTPERAFRMFEKILPKMNTTRIPKVHECTNGLARISVGVRTRDLLPRHQESCLNWEENFKTYIRLMTRQEGSVQKLSCCYRGAETCTYEIRWRRRSTVGASLATTAVLALSLFGAFESFRSRLGTMPSALLIAVMAQLAALVYLSLRHRGLLSERRRYDAEFEAFEKAANSRYSQLETTKSQLDKSYRELVLLKETSEAILRNNELSEILQTTLENVCSKFGFDRAFAMLVNESRTELSTAAIAGVEVHHDIVWQFKVDVSERRANSLVLSSVYHTGRTVVIHDTTKHLANLNDASKQLVAALGSESFLIVAIPSEQGSWGVVVVDKGKKGGVISDAEVSLVERMAHALGIALDKQARLESERRDRALFEKFVPAYAKKDLFTLGGETREIVAMFVDLQNFTAASEALGATAVVTVVNRFYRLVHHAAKAHDGYTDKFIGDAVLVTWGYLDRASNSCELAVRCALDVLKGLEEANEELLAQGMPRLSLRIGIQRGSAVCGLFGCDDRMEFTGIGSTINLASRLQSFCKEQSAAIAVSEDILNELPESLLDGWRVSSNVWLRGLQRPVRVAWLPASDAEQISNVLTIKKEKKAG